MIPINFKGRAKRLDALDLPRIGSMIGVGEDEMRAVLEVESRGSGFDKSGRPTMLFEPHVFWRELGKGKARDLAVREGLAYPTWGAQPYPKDSYPRLVRAMEIDDEAALRSASWGLGQLMGNNHRAAGYVSASAMVAAFCEDEENHLSAMVAFIKASRLDDELRAHDWTGFARGYNGPGYAKNAYHTRLARAFARWQAKPDLPFSLDLAAKEQIEGDAIAEETRKADHADSFVDRARIKAVQEKLASLGYHQVGKPDGHAGPRTAGAIAAFQTANGLPITGKIDDDLIGQLEAAHPAETSPARAEGEPEGSRIVEGGRASSTLGKGLTIPAIIAAGEPVLEQVEATKGLVERAKALVDPVRELLADYWPFILLGVGAWLAINGSRIVKARIEDHQRGKTA